MVLKFTVPNGPLTSTGMVGATMKSRLSTDRLENALIESDMLVFCLFGKTTVTYHNPSRRDTYSGLEVDKIVLTLKSGEEVSFSDGVVPAPYAQQVRSGEAATLDLYFIP